MIQFGRMIEISFFYQLKRKKMSNQKLDNNKLIEKIYSFIAVECLL